MISPSEQADEIMQTEEARGEDAMAPRPPDLESALEDLKSVVHKMEEGVPSASIADCVEYYVREIKNIKKSFLCPNKGTIDENSLSEIIVKALTKAFETRVDNLRIEAVAKNPEAVLERRKFFDSESAKLLNDYDPIFALMENTRDEFEKVIKKSGEEFQEHFEATKSSPPKKQPFWLIFARDIGNAAIYSTSEGDYDIEFRDYTNFIDNVDLTNFQFSASISTKKNNPDGGNIIQMVGKIEHVIVTTYGEAYSVLKQLIPELNVEEVEAKKRSWSLTKGIKSDTTITMVVSKIQSGENTDLIGKKMESGCFRLLNKEDTLIQRCVQIRGAPRRAHQGFLEDKCKVKKLRRSTRRAKGQKRKLEDVKERKYYKRSRKQEHLCINPQFTLAVLEEGQIFCNDCGRMIQQKESCWSCEQCNVFDYCKKCMQLYDATDVIV